ncbi:MAG: PIN domain-containing protein [Bifidobacteriaceae bacterium]|nr:PIN domain-containing protein [Bifidobacteriaceae bacterium]
MIPVFLDACVLAPITQANLLPRLAEAGLIAPYWSERILAEVEAAVLGYRPGLPPARVHARIDAMRLSFEEAMVIGYEDRLSEVQGPDPNDRHVIAAAATSPARLIVTHNLAHFPSTALLPFGLEAWHPDRLLTTLLDKHESVVIAVLQAMAAVMRKPEMTAFGVLAVLARSGNPRFTQRSAALLSQDEPSP